MSNKELNDLSASTPSPLERAGERPFPFIIGITGGSGSGKSSFARDLKAQFSDDEMTVLCEDNYYLPKDKVPVDANGWQNYDTPAAFDHALYITHVRNLKLGQPILKEEYTYYNPGVTPAVITMAPTPLIVVEGIFSLHPSEMQKLVDLKLYIDADLEARLTRRLARDAVERGLDRTDVEYRWNNHILPGFE